MRAVPSGMAQAVRIKIRPVRWWRSDEERYTSRPAYANTYGFFEQPRFEIEKLPPIDGTLRSMLESMDRQIATAMAVPIHLLWNNAKSTPIDDIKREMRRLLAFNEPSPSDVKIELHGPPIMDVGSKPDPRRFVATVEAEITITLPDWVLCACRIDVPIRVKATRKLRRTMRKYKRGCHRYGRCFITDRPL